MQCYFPGWASQLVVDYPERFTSEQACWAALVEEAARKAAGKAMGVAWGLAQLGIPCTVGELDGEAYLSPAGLFAPAGAFYEEEYLHDGGGCNLFAMRGRMPVPVPGCWRCGSKEHLRKDCSFPASEAELAGAPINQWAKRSPLSSSSSRTAGAPLAHGPAAVADKRWSSMALPPPPTPRCPGHRLRHEGGFCASRGPDQRPHSVARGSPGRGGADGCAYTSYGVAAAVHRGRPALS